MPEQCHATVKLLREKHERRCPAMALPGELYCPVHLDIVSKLEGRRRKLKRFWEKLGE